MTDHTRRSLLRTGAVTGAVGLAWAVVPTSTSRAALAAATGCTTLTPELTQGPFWVDERLDRSDIRADSTTGAVEAGIPLTLTIKLQDAGGDCTPQVGAYVDVWHANADGEYSDVSGSGNPDNRGQDWLRGPARARPTRPTTSTRRRSWRRSPAARPRGTPRRTPSASTSATAPTRGRRPPRRPGPTRPSRRR